MDSRKSSYSSTEENNPFTSSNETLATSSDDWTPDHININITRESAFSPLAPSFQSRMGNEYLHQPEIRPSDTGALNTDFEEAIFEVRLGNRSYSSFDVSEQNAQNDLRNAVPPTPVALNDWTDRGTGIDARITDMFNTYEFLIKSLSTAKSFVSTLSREQLSVLRSIPPIFLYEFLQQVANACSKKRTRRQLPNECAFCKNNGENEESYSSHLLKDIRGRVTCPVLRAFRCPRCSATGDRAHTIKYCPEPPPSGLNRSGGFLSRRRAASSYSLFSNSTLSLSGSDTSSSHIAASSSTNLNSSMWPNLA